MPSPVTPNEIKNTLPSVDSGVCDRLKKVIIDFPRKVYAWMSYVYNDDGTFTEEFKQELCSIDCDDIKLGGGGPDDTNGNGDGGGEGGTLKKITKLIATPATRHDGGITLLWPNDPVADTYTVYRTPTVTVKNTDSPGTQYAANSTAIKVEALVEGIASGKKLYFDNGTVLTLTAATAKGDTAITQCTLTGVLPDKEEGRLPAQDATILRKDGNASPQRAGWNDYKKGTIALRGSTCFFVDAHATKIWDGSDHVGKNSDGTTANVLDGGRRYNYWVTSQTNSGDYSAYSNVTSGFSEYVKGFLSDTGLCRSGGTDTYFEYPVLSSLTYPNSEKSYMRVVLRGGGGGGGAGGDHKQPTVVDYYVKTLTYTDSTTPIVFTLGGSSDPDITHWSVGDEVKLVDNGTNAFNTSYIVSEIVQGNKFKVTAVDMGGSSSAANGTIPNTSDASFGRVYRVKDKQKVQIPGAGGGAGAFLIAVFEVTDKISKVRVRTVDSTSGTALTVNYSDDGSNAFHQISHYLRDADASEDITYNQGGQGRQSATVHPTAGEPSANTGADTGVALAGDPTTNIADGLSYSKPSLIPPYFTLLEVYSTSDNGWHEVARVADGHGGGYRNGFTNYISVGGLGGKTATTTNFSTHCVLKTGTMTKLTGASGGKFIRKGSDGTDGTAPLVPGPTAGGTPGRGGHIWDGLVTMGYQSPLQVKTAGGLMKSSGGSNFDESAPGGGGSGSYGDTKETQSRNCIGGAAIAGCAWVTYSDTLYTKF